MTQHEDWLLTPQRVAVHQPTATAVVADMHLGYQEARRLSGDAVPLVDMATSLAPLLLVLQQHKVQRFVIAGDLFEKAFDRKLWHEFKTHLAETGVHFLGLIPGNHDRGLEEISPDLPLLPDGLSLGGWHVVHGDSPLPEAPMVHGHFHPSIRHRGRRLPCYLLGARRLVLPAYSRDAAGVNVSPVMHWRGCRCLAIISATVLDLGILAGT